jgi:hypothetical protein
MPTVKRLCSDDPEALDLLDRVTVNGPGEDHGNQYTGGKVGNSNSATKTVKNDRSYALRRLRKSRPDLHERVLRRELSAHAAMKKAGFVKELTPLNVLKRAWVKASREENDKAVKRIKETLTAIPAWWTVNRLSVASLAIENKAQGLNGVFELAGMLADKLGIVTIYRHRSWFGT